ncbi:hypothetical protein BGX26_000716 [Mortierella sp. AD094]|nr:hypothetical protein BGX26_000716 [Mortierella sp. AD094]
MAAMVATASAQFIAYSEPHYKGHQQSFNFKGVKDSQYTFYADSGCSGKLLYRSSSAPISKIRPAIHNPRSFKILAGRVNSTSIALVTSSRSHYSGSKQTLKGTGCLPLSGQKVSSFKGYGGYRYKFFADGVCTGSPSLQSKGGDKSNTRTIKPQSVYIYKN